MTFKYCLLQLYSAASLAKAFLHTPSSIGVPGVNRTFDYVVVGAGTSGAALASRLAADGRFSVAIIEAGGFYETTNGNLSTIPGSATFHTGSDPNDTQPLIDWGFVTTPQAGAGDRIMHYARGKTYGGSSATNYMAYQRPTIGAMQQWADEVEDQSFTFAETLPFFEKSVQFHQQDTSLRPNASNSQTSTGFSVSGGPLQVSYSNYVDSYATWFRLALQGIGQRAVDGFNSGKLIGSAWMTWTINPKNGERSSSQSSFLRQAMADTSTLQTYPQSLAEKVIFNGTRATGVLVSTAGSYGTPDLKFVLQANREVLIAAGVFQSPQLLMVSGIGPRATLQQHNISVIKDAPGVGQNLWDQPFWGLSIRVKLPTVSAMLNDPAYAAAVIAAYNHNGTGPLSEFGSGYFGWEKIPTIRRVGFSSRTNEMLSHFPEDWPEAEFFGINSFVGLQRNFQTDQPVDGTNYAGIAAALVTPSSRGSVSINSSRMSDPPIIDPNWLTDSADQELAIAIFKRQRDVFQQLQNLNITYEQEVVPGPAVQTDEQILGFIRQGMHTIWHAAATCKMGRLNDSMAVVDSHTRVIGTQSLRVVDASAFPFLTPGHPQSVIYMLAEKIADQILQKA